MTPRSRTPRSTHLLAGLGLLAALAGCGGGDDDDPAAVTTSGTVRGEAAASSNNFLGIPYAAPPVGTLRWRAPAAPAPWSGVREAKRFAPHCAQPASPFGVASTSEDCLYLNVFTPKAPGTYPVIVWIHGGAFYLGESDGYDPTRLVQQGNVVVTVNYRLGALGFMSHAALSAEQGGRSGNYGLMDQQAALHWVRSNIAAFHGDPRNVTIAGESAGGFSVHSHVASPGSAGLFHKAIAMSGAYPFGAPQDTLAQAEAKGAVVATAAGTALSTPACTTAACLRALPVSTLLAAQMAAYPSGPVPPVDGVVLTQDVRTTIAAGTHNAVPMIEGTTRDEWRLFAALDEYAANPVAPAPVLHDDAELIAKVTTLLGGPANPAAGPTATAMVTNFYPSAAYADTATAYGALGTDMIFSCSARIAALELQQHRPVYAYEFRDRTAPAALPHRSSFDMGAHHTSELQYLFNMSAPLNAEQQALSTAMVQYWSNFARTGDPNGTGLPTWAAYTQANDSLQGLDVTSNGGIAAFGSFAADHRCLVWNQGNYTPTP
ncbi:MAG: carboxylesterase family protein [Rhizobacter sp.]|nr:carboxylesterase family protein [Rhizobacter sp.]